MALAYKTPGVYIEEISKFPPSIAAVETAIPAFIGYTEKAIKNNQSLINKPVRVESLAEFEQIFGGAPPQPITIYLDTNNEVINAHRITSYVLYDSLRLFYANGGGNTYIVSVGDYSKSIDASLLKGGLDEIEKEDEPTLLLMPDAVNLEDIYNVQIKALTQCNKLKDRFTICDTKYNININETVQEFREKIGISYLKYGAAYAPWLNTNLPRTIYYRDITLKYKGENGGIILFKNLTNDSKLLQIIDSLEKAQLAVDELNKYETETEPSKGSKWSDKFKIKFEAYNSSQESTLSDLANELQDIYDLISQLVNKLQTLYANLPDPAGIDFKLKTDIKQYQINNKLKDEFDKIATYYNILLARPVSISIFTEDPSIATTDLAKALKFLGYSNSADFKNTNISSLEIDYDATTSDKAKADLIKKTALDVSNKFIAFYNFAKNSASEYEKKFNDSLYSNFGFYKSIINKSIDFLNLIPPSGAIAGVYASVDRERGVWKAPANISLNAVSSPSSKITMEQQGEYNIDVNAGKSINIIRSFTGKGTLVWGARTLAGNDNEWRYISVRRFFNFVEESIKKATEQFVFEPNDANTWVKVQAMIENFLTTLWRQGALQGVKPEHAFYVSIGLGKTMTAQDISEGRLIIEIGLAAVRPAEFIIIRFSHKMAES